MFTGEGNGWFRAYDAKSGKVLWSFQAGAGVNAPPSTYTIGGKQYIAVAAGGSRPAARANRDVDGPAMSFQPEPLLLDPH